MKVVAKKGTRCPMEGKPREYITDSVAVPVVDTVYYRRLVKDGSLIEEKEKVTSVKRTTEKKEEKKSTKKTNKGGK
ncbi:MAG: DUF2635 domain-containing protein [Deltaproteobacteria bacterium]|nr:DUF2635 domain-containing protein [Deltaproteobacteria bacterium]